MKEKKTGKWLWTLASGQKGKILLLMALRVMGSFLAALTAWLFRGLIDRAVAGDGDGLFWYGAALVVTIAGILAANAAVRHFSELVKATLENIYKSRLYGEILTRRYAAVRQVHGGEWMNRLTSDTVVVAGGITTILPELAGLAAGLCSALILLLMLLPELTWVVFPLGAGLIVVTYLFRKKLKKLHKLIQEADGSLRVYLSEHIANLLIVRSFGQEYRSKEQAEALMAKHREARMRRNRFMNICNVGFGVLMRGGYVAGAIYCAAGILRGSLSYGTFVAVTQLIGQVQSPFASVSGYIPQIYAVLASAERLMEIENAPRDVPVKDGDTADFEAIGFSDLSFSYKDRGTCAVLEHLSFEVRRGESAAITGISGRGKSTVLKLLMGLYPPDGGEGYLVEKGTGRRRPLLPQDRGLFAYVPQGNQLMSGEVREVLTFGEAKDGAEDDRLWAALDVACMKEIVEREGGLSAVLGENGRGFSEGQLQRLAIARAIVSGRPVLLLDEATSALDEATERRLLENLRRLTDRTVITVTHRKTVLSICDKEIELK